MDDNEYIIDLIKQRLDKGKAEYNHGVRVNDDTQEWGCESWEEMALEEILDGMIYTAASIIKLQRKLKKSC